MGASRRVRPASVLRGSPVAGQEACGRRGGRWRWGGRWSWAGSHLCKEGGLALSGVLAMSHPRVERPASHIDAVELAAVKRLTERAHTETGRAARRTLRHEILLPFERVEVKVCKINRGAVRHIAAPRPTEHAGGLIVGSSSATRPRLPVSRHAHSHWAAGVVRLRKAHVSRVHDLKVL